MRDSDWPNDDALLMILCVYLHFKIRNSTQYAGNNAELSNSKCNKIERKLLNYLNMRAFNRYTYVCGSIKLNIFVLKKIIIDFAVRTALHGLSVSIGFPTKLDFCLW